MIRHEARMKTPQIIAKVVYFLEGDEDAAEYQSMLIEYSGQHWIVASWIQEPATGMRMPETIVPLAKLPHIKQQDGLIRLGVLMPAALLSPDAPAELLCKFGAVA